MFPRVWCGDLRYFVGVGLVLLFPEFRGFPWVDVVWFRVGGLLFGFDFWIWWVWLILARCSCLSGVWFGGVVWVVGVLLFGLVGCFCPSCSFPFDMRLVQYSFVTIAFCVVLVDGLVWCLVADSLG